jgi:DNA modification methylase
MAYNREYNKIAKIHKYWSRKPWYVIEHLINKYSLPSQIVLDPFCGSGAIGLEAVLNNREFIGYDLNPVAVFVSKNTLDLEFDAAQFDEETAMIEKSVKSQIMKLYEIPNSNLFIRYLLPGKHGKPYNCVATDSNFGNKQNLTVGDDLLKKHFAIPDKYTFPDMNFPEKFYKDRFSYKGVKRVSDMFSSRNLLALAILFDYLHNANLKCLDLFSLAFTNTLLHVSKLKAENVRPLSVNNYWIPDDYIEENVIWRFFDRVQNVRRAKLLIEERRKFNCADGSVVSKIYNKSSVKLAEIEDQSIDYILTDPPYGDAIQYSELSYIWNCWRQKEFKIKDEVIINPVQNKGISEFHDQLSIFISNAKRVLKPDAYFTLCFQNKELKIWLGIINSVKNAGFDLCDLEVYDTFGSPYNKYWAKFSPKSDLYATFRNVSVRSCRERGTIKPYELIQNIVKYMNDTSTFDLNKGYDLFVMAMIRAVFANQSVSEIETLDLKKIVSMFESEQPNGTKFTSSSKNTQLQFSF